MTTERTGLGPQVVAITAMLTVIAAALALAPSKQAATAANGATWLQQIETGADHIAPRELADALLRTPSDLVLVDLRPATEFAAWHLPGAHNLTVPDVCGAAGAALFTARPELVVLCSNGPAHPGQARVELQRQGHRNVRVLAGGLADFKAQVLTPPSLREGASESGALAARADYERLRELLRDTTPNRGGR